MLCKVTHCAGRVSANTRPHQLRWGDREMGTANCSPTATSNKPESFHQLHSLAYSQVFHFLIGYSQIYTVIHFILLEIIKVSTRFEATCKYRESFVPNYITCKAVEGDKMLSHHPLDNTKQWQYTQYLM